VAGVPVIDAAPYQVVLAKLHEDGANDHEIARRIGFSAPTVRNIRTSRTKMIHEETAQAIAMMLVRAK
jgi:DNA-binding CsgD family transcriptional regulator